MSFNIHITNNIESFKNIIKLILKFTKTAIFEMSKNNLRITSPNKTNTSLLAIRIQKHFFQTYEVNNIHIPIDIAKLDVIIRHSTIVSIYNIDMICINEIAKSSTLLLDISYIIFGYMTNTLFIETDESKNNIEYKGQKQELKYVLPDMMVECTLPMYVFSNIIKKIDNESEMFNIFIDQKNIKFIYEDDDYDVTYSLLVNNLTNASLQQTYFCMDVRPILELDVTNITIKMKPDYPLMLSAILSNHINIDFFCVPCQS